MKAKVLYLLFVFFFTTMFINAQTKNERIVSKTESNGSGYTKEIVFLHKNGRDPKQRMVYNYDNNGYLLQKVVYMYDRKKAPVALHKINCEYDSKNKPLHFTLAKWDKNSGRWVDNCEEMTYYYDSSDKVMVVRTSNENYR